MNQEIQKLMQEYVPKKIRAYGETFEVEPKSKASITSSPKQEDLNSELFFNIIRRGMRT